jgi:hypothetical protein
VLGGRDMGQFTKSFSPLLTPEGVRHPIFANIADFFPTRQGAVEIAGLPPLDGCTRIKSPRPGASVLATLPADAGEMPILAVQPLERGRTAVFAADTTRKWQQGPRALGRDSPFLRFWGQMVRWLAGRGEAVTAQAGIVASADKAVYQPAETVRMSAVVHNREGQGAEGAKLTASISGPGDSRETVPLSPVAGPSGHYAARFEPRYFGRYEVVVRAELASLKLEAEKIVFDVGRSNLEFERLDLDEKTLSAITTAAKGRYVSLSAADHLVDQLDRAEQRKAVQAETRLAWPPVTWTLFVAIVTAEWILRRRYQLR